MIAAEATVRIRFVIIMVSLGGAFIEGSCYQIGQLLRRAFRCSWNRLRSYFTLSGFSYRPFHTVGFRLTSPRVLSFGNPRKPSEAPATKRACDPGAIVSVIRTPIVCLFWTLPQRLHTDVVADRGSSRYANPGSGSFAIAPTPPPATAGSA